VSTHEFALYDAAYVLGALSPAERSEFEAHLDGCVACACSTDELSGLPDLLSMVSVEEVTVQPEALPETLLPSLVRAVRREQVRRRLAVGTAAAAAACLIAVGAVALTRPDSPARPPVGSSASAPASTTSGTANLVLSAVVPSPITASARLVDVAWGTRIDLTCAYNTKGHPSGDGRPYAMVVIDRSGAAQQVAAWTALPNRELTVMGASSLARRDIAAVEIRTLSGRAILRLST
jgi:Putative zinc-finger